MYQSKVNNINIWSANSIDKSNNLSAYLGLYNILTNQINTGIQIIKRISYKLLQAYQSIDPWINYAINQEIHSRIKYLSMQYHRTIDKNSRTKTNKLDTLMSSLGLLHTCRESGHSSGNKPGTRI